MHIKSGSKFLTFCIIFLSFCCFCYAKKEDEILKKKFKSKENGFSVIFPNDPSITKETHIIEGKKLTFNSYKSLDKKTEIEFTLSLCNIPDEILMNISENKLLNNFMTTRVKGQNLLSSKEIMVVDCPGLEYTFNEKTGGKMVIGKAFLIYGKLYIGEVFLSKANKDKYVKVADHFFSKLKFSSLEKEEENNKEYSGNAPFYEIDPYTIKDLSESSLSDLPPFKNYVSKRFSYSVSIPGEPTPRTRKYHSFYGGASMGEGEELCEYIFKPADITFRVEVLELKKLASYEESKLFEFCLQNFSDKDEIEKMCQIKCNGYAGIYFKQDDISPNGSNDKYVYGNIFHKLGGGKYSNKYDYFYIFKVEFKHDEDLKKYAKVLEKFFYSINIW
ncbi:hypothetical protein KAJ27_02905 [bacterium]|nr:hypothetical protein [bacterium]